MTTALVPGAGSKATGCRAIIATVTRMKIIPQLMPETM